MINELQQLLERKHRYMQDIDAALRVLRFIAASLQAAITNEEKAPYLKIAALVEPERQRLSLEWARIQEIEARLINQPVAA